MQSEGGGTRSEKPKPVDPVTIFVSPSQENTIEAGHRSAVSHLQLQNCLVVQATLASPG